MILINVRSKRYSICDLIMDQAANLVHLTKIWQDVGQIGSAIWTQLLPAYYSIKEWWRTVGEE